MKLSERLRRELAWQGTQPSVIDMCTDAADEIDRLTVEVAALRERIAAADAEAVPDVGVLVEALLKIADGAHAAGDIAQQALAEWEAKR